MKKEINPAILYGVVALVVVGIVLAFFLVGRTSNATVDLSKIDPRDLRDEDPIRRGQPGYRERIDEAPR